MVGLFALCPSRSYIVLKRLKISTQFLLRTTAPCLSRIVLQIGWDQSTPSARNEIMPQSDPLDPPCWFERRGHSIRNCEWSKIPQGSQPSFFRMVPSLTSYKLPFPQNGVPNTPHRTNFATHAATWRIWLKISTRFLLHTTDTAFCQITLTLVKDHRHNCQQSKSGVSAPRSQKFSEHGVELV